jgi:hypothetical protein
MADTKRRARGEDSIFFAPSRGCWVGEITVGWKPDGRRDRITVRGRPRPMSRTNLGQAPGTGRECPDACPLHRPAVHRRLAEQPDHAVPDHLDQLPDGG